MTAASRMGTPFLEPHTGRNPGPGQGIPVRGHTHPGRWVKYGGRSLLRVRLALEIELDERVFVGVPEQLEPEHAAGGRLVRVEGLGGPLEAEHGPEEVDV